MTLVLSTENCIILLLSSVFCLVLFCLFVLRQNFSTYIFWTFVLVLKLDSEPKLIVFLPCFTTQSDSAFNWETFFFPKALSLHPWGFIQVTGFNISIVHCGIMPSDLLHIQSLAFEGFWDFVLWECSAQHLKTHFITCMSSNMLFRQKLIEDWP